MKRQHIRQLVFMGAGIAVTCLAMVFVDHRWGPGSAASAAVSAKNGILALSGALVQKKILVGGDGRVSLALDIRAADGDGVRNGSSDAQPVDMVIVLDRSGSMSGSKIEDARRATLRLVQDLTSRDRFALVAYSNTAAVYSGLTHVTPQSKAYLMGTVQRISATGGTNLGQGLQEGIRILADRKPIGNLGRLLLISDGLANHGITDPSALGNMAAAATEKGFSISTVGLGYDFNEQLMTTIADRGAGTYHFMENPSAFASVFGKELNRTREVAASSVKVRVTEKDGLRLVGAGGYPILHENGKAVFYPGDLRYGESRRLYLDLKVPAGREASLEISGIDVQYIHNRKIHEAALPEPLRLACVTDPGEAVSSIEEKIWTDKVLTEDFNRLREDVAGDIKAGRPKAAAEKIDRYRVKHQAINTEVKSPAVAKNLEADLKDLEETVSGTFSGDRDEIPEKQKKNSKTLQYKGYQERRMKN